MPFGSLRKSHRRRRCGILFPFMYELLEQENEHDRVQPLLAAPHSASRGEQLQLCHAHDSCSLLKFDCMRWSSLRDAVFLYAEQRWNRNAMAEFKIFSGSFSHENGAACCFPVIRNLSVSLSVSRARFLLCVFLYQKQSFPASAQELLTCPSKAGIVSFASSSNFSPDDRYITYNPKRRSPQKGGAKDTKRKI